jgi:CRISPR-associated protein Cas2
LLDYGPRVQYSVFEAELDAETLARLRQRIEATVAPAEDSVRIYPHCAAARPASRSSARGPYLNIRNSL